MLKAFVMEIIRFGTFSWRSQAGHINKRNQEEKSRTEHHQIFENTQSWKGRLRHQQQDVLIFIYVSLFVFF